METKSIFKSRTFWVAVTQALMGVVVAFQSAYPEAGALLIAKALLDMALRIETTQPVK